MESFSALFSIKAKKEVGFNVYLIAQKCSNGVRRSAKSSN
ncbi:hypothetical protein NT01EI_2379 [Edwardsiella ictaluri 93-146]|uniref:Uncharacterized protein n=1 Tax=Edwardsiella ictaluri (strain 93-146) TaxID=634503 RepID=C5BA70_EDWI9|nr:hypothetical protein NT01EI_2379 [Edwardsiella ictaluri 93-146]